MIFLKFLYSNPTKYLPEWNDIVEYQIVSFIY